MKTPFFSIVMPTYNRAAFLDRSIGSILKQHFLDWELLIIDDGSTDNTKSVVEKYLDGKFNIKYLYQKNQKASVARNLGLQHAAGRYICFLDSDDEYRSDHLQQFYDYLVSYNFPQSFLCSGLILDNGLTRQEFFPPELNEYPDPEFNKIMSVFLPFSPCVQTICLPSSIKDRLQFDPRLFPSECYDFCARAASLVSEVKFFRSTTIVLHEHQNNVSIPKSEQDAFRFNVRQYEEFRIMAGDVFYGKIKRTKIFQHKLFNLKLEIAKFYLRKKRIFAFAQSFSKALTYNPRFIFGSAFQKASKKISKKAFSISR